MCFLVITKVELQGWRQCILVNVLIMGVVLITEDMGVLLICNHLQSQDMSIQTDACKSRIGLGNLPSLALQANSSVMRIAQAILLMPQSSNLG